MTWRVDTAPDGTQRVVMEGSATFDIVSAGSDGIGVRHIFTPQEYAALMQDAPRVAPGWVLDGWWHRDPFANVRQDAAGWYWWTSVVGGSHGHADTAEAAMEAADASLRAKGLVLL